jgi:iron complex outermembrane receptor protein
MKKIAYSIACSLPVLALSLAVTDTAHAQTAPTSPSQTASASLPATPEAKPGQDSTGEIVVTGLKRDTQLINTPVSVAVYDSMKIQNAGIKQPTDFLQLTSNVNITTSVNKGDLLINVRGESSVRNAEPTVAVIVDGAKIGTPAEFNSALFDLEQIEVIKGPQGAIYGRDATSGAIIITTKKPTEEFSGSATASYGQNDSYNVVMDVSGALIPNALRARLSASVNGDDGSYTNAVTGEHPMRYYEKALRGRMTWDTGGPFTADARVTYIHGNGGADSYTPKINAGLNGTPNTVVVHGDTITDISANKNLDVPYISDVAGRYKRNIVSSSLKMDYNLGFATITSITGFSHSYEIWGGKNYPYSNAADGLTNYQGWDSAVFGDKTQNSRKQVNQIQEDLRITSNGNHFLDWQAGVEFTRSREHYSTWNSLDGALPASLLAQYATNPSVLNGFGGYINGQRVLIGGGNPVPWPLVLQGLNTAYPTTNVYDSRFTNHNYGPYANVTAHFTSRLSLLVAARYDIETRNAGSIGPSIANPFLGGLSYNPCVRFTGETPAQCNAGENATFHELQPKVTLNYTLDGHGSIYASWGRSFKSGGFNAIGTRAGSVQARAAIDLAANPALTPAEALALANTQVIAQDTYKKEVATTYEAGFKVNMFDRRLYLNGAVFWTDITNGQLYVFDPVSNLESIQSIDKERVKGFEFDGTFQLTNAIQLFASYGYVDPRIRKLAADPADVGNRPPYVALNSLSVGTQIVQPISDTKKLVARFEYNRTGKTYYSLDNDTGFMRSPYGVANGRLGISTDRWDATVYARNIFNKHYVNEIAPIITGVATAVSLAELRQVGAEFRVRF